MRRRLFLASSAEPDHTTRPRCRMCARSATASALRVPVPVQVPWQANRAGRRTPQ